MAGIVAAADHAKSAVQIVLRWHVQRGFVTIPKSTDPAHIAANIDVFDFELSPAQMSAIDALGKDRPMFRMPRWAMSALMSLARRARAHSRLSRALELRCQSPPSRRHAE